MRPAIGLEASYVCRLHLSGSDIFCLGWAPTPAVCPEVRVSQD